MSEQYQPSKEITEFENRLAALNPPAANIDRDELMYRSGFAAAESQFKSSHWSLGAWAWPASSAALATLCAALAIMLFQQPTSEPSNLASNRETNTKAVVEAPTALVQSTTTEKSSGSLEDSLAESNRSARQLASTPSVFGLKIQAFSNPLNQRQMQQFNQPYQASNEEESFVATPYSPSTVGTLLNELISNEEAF